ncbi:hypothetical protein RSAG8_10036, partial [Rhizoctonia solani AG-8 WAC10335]
MRTSLVTPCGYKPCLDGTSTRRIQPHTIYLAAITNLVTPIYLHLGLGCSQVTRTAEAFSSFVRGYFLSGPAVSIRAEAT